MNANAIAFNVNNDTKAFKTPAFLKGGIRFYGFVICLLALTFFTANFFKNASWGIGPFVLVIGLMIVSFLFSGFSIYSALFATIAVIPNLNSFLPLGVFSLTLVEIYMSICICFFLMKPIRINRVALFIAALFFCSILSLIGSPLGFLAAGLILRFGILLVFIALLIVRQADPVLIKSLFSGFLLIPLIACTTYAGEDVLVGIFSANILAFSRAVYSFQYPIWFSLVIPLLVYLKAPRLIILAASIFVAGLFILSFARSIILGTGMAGILYLFYYNDRKPVLRIITKTIICIGIIGVIFLVTIVLKFFEFSSMDNESNVARFEKMPIAFNKFREHPLFGAGFGASHDNEIAQKTGVEVFNEQISPEFGPLTALSEIGLIGSFFLFYLIYLSVRCSIKCLKDRDIYIAYKLVILITFGGLISSFLNSNSLASIIVYIFLCFPFVLYKNRKFAI